MTSTQNFIVELVSNASMDVYPANTIASFTNFLPEQINLEGDWEVALLEVSYPNLYHNITDGRFRYKHNDNDTDLEIMEIPPGLYNSLSDILASMREVAEKKGKLITLWWDVNNRTQKVEIVLPFGSSGLNIISPDLAHILGFPMSFLLMGVGPHFSHYPIDILRIHSVMIYTDIIEHGIVGDTKAPLLRSFPFISKLKNSQLVTLQFMNYQTFTNPQFKRILKHSFHSIAIDMRTTTTGELIPFVAVGFTRLTLMFRKIISRET